jgi:putative PIN family toxin of toxin-antitoxin system
VIRVVVDANVLASGFTSGGSPPDRLLRAWLAGDWELMTLEEILSEVERTLHKPYFFRRLGPEGIARNLSLLRERAVITPLSVAVHGIATHPEDDLVLATALSAHADYLVTGDGPLQKLGTYRGVAILSPRALLLGLTVYGPEGFQRFLRTPLREFEGRTALQLLEVGETGRVLAALAADYEGLGS